ncbi:regulator of sigma E protease [Trypanosoma cruzi]|nr:regulator of sigma E protease [Trypanosoma cruzi]
MFCAEHFLCSSSSPNSCPSASAPPYPTSPSCKPGQPMRPASAPCCGRRPQSKTSTHPSRGTATSATPASSRPHRHPAAPCHQRRCSRGAPPAIAAFESTTTDSALPRTPATFLNMLRLAICG